ncbi:uncharacterized protein LOC103720875 [Phoenix dactylifera]|uniref:Uncharacterized protein LOC103720875 n=1 Tax=Phoenix dactylifera TaxID=42345 RepID=A0A8B7CYD5_PHODC|nr:uncharacterized protein LOC103720875 [Phoenix dactylifera]
MATNWLKSLSCNSNAVADGVTNPKPVSKKAKNPHPFAACRRSDSVRDVLSPFPKYTSSPLPKIPSLKEPKPKSKSRPCPPVAAAASAVREVAPPANSFPALSELPEGHSSRRVVEIIFRSSWGRPPFAGEIEMLFRVQHPPKAAARFEEYRSAVRSRPAASGAARCAADGNEMMRFHCAPSSASAGGGEVYDAAALGKAGEGIRTFDGSGGAHASGGGGAGRGAMLLCRVIAGRVRTGSEQGSETPTGFDSLLVGKGELLVFDPRAVLPCFLIIYKI